MMFPYEQRPVNKPVFWNPFGDTDDAQCPVCGGNEMFVSRSTETGKITLACVRLACTWKGSMTDD